MSSHSDSDIGSVPRRPVTLPQIAAMKTAGDPIVMVTAYDFPSARVAEKAGVDMVLVGDSAANVVLGYPDTTRVGIDEMVMLAAAVRRGLETPLLVGDLPFGSYEATDELAVASSQRFVKEAGCDAVKLERGGTSARRAAAIVAAGIPVVGHVGLTPQTAVSLGGYKAQGRTTEAALAVAREAVALQRAGCFAIVFEALPAAVTDELMSLMEIPVIGCGAGPDTDGQVIVFHDLLGIGDGHVAKFVKQYASVGDEMVAGIAAYAAEVRSLAFPGPEHIYAIEPGELEGLRDAIAALRHDAAGADDWDWSATEI